MLLGAPGFWDEDNAFKPQELISTISCPQLECQLYGNGAHLASLQNIKEANMVAKYIRGFQINQPVWIGLHDPQKVTSELVHRCPLGKA